MPLLRDVIPTRWSAEYREARRMLGSPLAARREWVDELAAATGAGDRNALRAIRFGWGSAVYECGVVRGVGVVQIKGPLVQGTYFHDYSDIRAAIAELSGAAGVHSILLDIDSPGGDVHAELFELCEQIRAVRAQKPVYALSNQLAASAAYVIASQASKLYGVNENTSIVGSIGVIAVHVDWSKMNARMGVEITEVVTGRHKNELSPDRPLSTEGRSTLERLVEGAFVELIDTVTAGRKALTEANIRGMEAAVFLAGAARNVDLVDGIASREELVEQLVAKAQASGIYVPAATAPANGGNMDQPTTTADPAAQAAAAAAQTEVAAQAAAAAATAAAATQAAGATVVDLDAVRAQVRGESRAEAREIVSLCGLAGVPAFAATLLAEDGMTVAVARERIQAERVRASGAEIETAVDAGANGAQAGPRINTAEVYRRWNGGPRSAKAKE